MQYDFSLTPYEAKQYEVFGRFVKYVQGSAPIRVILSAGGYVDLMPGQGVWNVDFKNFVIEDRSGSDNRGVVMAGSFDFRDDRISGTVEVIDGGKARTLAGMAFSIATAPGTGATVNSRVAMLNPAGSVKNLVLESIAFAPNAVSTANLYAGNGPIGLADPGVSKHMGEGALISVAQVSKDNTTTATGPSAGVIWQMSAQAGARDVWTPREPIIIPPGRSIIVWCNSKNVDFAALFEWFEDPILP